MIFLCWPSKTWRAKHLITDKPHMKNSTHFYGRIANPHFTQFTDLLLLSKIGYKNMHNWVKLYLILKWATEIFQSFPRKSRTLKLQPCIRYSLNYVCLHEHDFTLVNYFLFYKFICKCDSCDLPFGHETATN